MDDVLTVNVSSQDVDMSTEEPPTFDQGSVQEGLRSALPPTPPQSPISGPWQPSPSLLSHGQFALNPADTQANSFQYPQAQYSSPAFTQAVSQANGTLHQSQLSSTGDLLGTLNNVLMQLQHDTGGVKDGLETMWAQNDIGMGLILQNLLGSREHEQSLTEVKQELNEVKQDKAVAKSLNDIQRSLAAMQAGISTILGKVAKIDNLERLISRLSESRQTSDSVLSPNTPQVVVQQSAITHRHKNFLATVNVFRNTCWTDSNLVWQCPNSLCILVQGHESLFQLVKFLNDKIAALARSEVYKQEEDTFAELHSITDPGSSVGQAPSQLSDIHHVYSWQTWVESVMSPSVERQFSITLNFVLMTAGNAKKRKIEKFEDEGHSMNAEPFFSVPIEWNKVLTSKVSKE